MKKLIVSELHNKTVKELLSMKHKMESELHKLKMKKMTNALSQPHLLSKHRKNIARVSMVLNHKFRYTNVGK